MLRIACVAAAVTACTYNTTNNYGPQPDARASDARPGAVADARPGSGDPTSCGAPLPTSAPATIDISGTVTALTSGGAMSPAGITVALVDADPSAPRASAITDANGAFTIVAPSGGAPIDGYLHLSGPGFVDGYDYPAVPYAKDTTATLIATDASWYASIAGLGATPQDPSKAYLFVRTLDCAGQPLAGATITVTPHDGETVSYPNGSSSGSFGSSTSNVAMAIANNVHPGPVLVDGEPSLRGHVVDARWNELTIVEITP
jgi:hypothetical protein